MSPTELRIRNGSSNMNWVRNNTLTVRPVPLANTRNEGSKEMFMNSTDNQLSITLLITNPVTHYTEWHTKWETIFFVSNTYRACKKYQTSRVNVLIVVNDYT